jgi:signal transduction histidine kinase/PAS domain-containing protein
LSTDAPVLWVVVEMSADMAIPNNDVATSNQPRLANITAFPNVISLLTDTDADLSDILAAIADGVIVRNAERRLLYVNEAAARLLGYSSIPDFMSTSNEEFDSRFDFADELGRRVERSNLPSWRALRGELSPEVTLRHRNRVTGLTGWAVVKSRPVFDDQNKVRMTVTVIHDITEQKRTEEELRQARDELERNIAERTAKHSAANAVLQDHLAKREETRKEVGTRTVSLREQARSRFVNGAAGVRLQWMATSFLFLALGLIGVGFIYPRLFSDPELPTQLYLSVGVWSLASAMLVTGLIPATPPRLAIRTFLVIVAVFSGFVAIVFILVLSLPRVVDIPGGNGQALTAASETGANGWHWISFAVPMALAIIAILGVARRGRGETAIRWVALALVLWAGARLFDLAFPEVQHSTFNLANLLRLTSATILACGAVIELRRLVIQRDRLLAIEQSYSAKLEDLAVLKTDFTAMVAHELGLPVAAIRTLTAMAHATTDSPEDHTRALNAIDVEAVLLNSLVNDIETAANIEREDFAVALRPVELVEILAEAEAFAATLPGEHPLTTTIGGRAGVLVDRDRIAQVLHNLLSNAAKYSPPGTPIAIRAIPEKSKVRIEVEDRGFGIDSEDLSRIFGKFGRGRDSSGRRVPGVGLGLYVSRRIVRMHGSELTVDSTPGTGTIFGFGLERVR